ncbi:MAG: TetR/AcrR family transcriptional regulator [Dermatophilaceae bacterium]|nr:TetR/AcrR family transcriptional regulator [Dermatophilaceae bacterium]NUR82350.1 TetR/AcrR family transcriptional regulator [Dermatophilaceae bacterium]
MTPRTGTATTSPATAKETGKAAPPARSRDRIMDAASELAKERGVSGATIARVCQRSGLPVSSVYWYFDDKDHLFAEVIRASYAKWLVSVPRWDVSTDTTIAEGLRRVMGQSTRTFAEMPAFLRIGMQVLLETGEVNAKSRAAYIDVREQVRLMISAWITQLLPDNVSGDLADDLANLVIAISDGIVVGSQVYPDFDADAYVELMAGTIDAIAASA